MGLQTLVESEETQAAAAMAGMSDRREERWLAPNISRFSTELTGARKEKLPKAEEGIIQRSQRRQGLVFACCLADVPTGERGPRSILREPSPRPVRVTSATLSTVPDMISKSC